MLLIGPCYGILGYAIPQIKFWNSYVLNTMKFHLILLSLVILAIMLNKRSCPFHLVLLLVQSFFYLIHVDIWSPYRVPSFEGHKYFLIVVDDFNIFTWIYLLKTKAEVKTVLLNFILFIPNQFVVKLKKLRTDNGREFFPKDFLNSYGIFHETFCLETPRQNGIVERKYQHLLNVGRALLFQSNSLFIFGLMLLDMLSILSTSCHPSC